MPTHAAFLRLVRDWDADSVRLVLEEKPDFATRIERSGRTPLHHLAHVDVNRSSRPALDSVTTAKVLIDKGTDVNAIQQIPDDSELFPATALWCAIAWGRNEPLAHFFLDVGARPVFCLQAAAWNQDVDLASRLLSHGASVHDVFHGETPFMMAVKQRKFACFELLLDHGADISFQDARGWSVLHYAIQRKFNLTEIEKLLRAGANPRARDVDGITAMHLAAKLKRTRILRLLERFASDNG